LDFLSVSAYGPGMPTIVPIRTREQNAQHVQFETGQIEILSGIKTRENHINHILLVSFSYFQCLKLSSFQQPQRVLGPFPIRSR